MRRSIALILVALVLVALASLVAIYGIWLVATPDADGGRRPFGLMMIALAGVISFTGAALLWASSRRRVA